MTVVENNFLLDITLTHSIGPDLVIIVHTIVGTIEVHPLNSRVSLDPCSLFKTIRKVSRDFAEYRYLSFDDFLFSTSRHVTRNGLNESVFRLGREDLLPQCPYKGKNQLNNQYENRDTYEGH